MSRFSAGFLCVAFILGGSAVSPFAASAQAASPDEPLLQQFREHLNHDWFNLGGLLQFVGSSGLRSEADRGFEIANLRIKLNGRFDAGYRYAFQMNIRKEATLLDARMSYEYAPGQFVDMGAYKTPFSGEFLIPASGIDFVNRSVTALLIPGRQIGMGVSGSVANGFNYGAGVYNGNGVTANGNDDNDFLFVGRAGLRRDLGDGFIDAGAGAAYEKREPLPGDDENTERTYGADFRFEQGRVMVSGEFVHFEFETPASAKVTGDADAFHATAGVRTSARTQVLVRYEGFSAFGSDDFRNQVIGGLNIWPTSVTEFQFNVVLPTEGDLEDGEVLVNAQIGF